MNSILIKTRKESLDDEVFSLDDTSSMNVKKKSEAVTSSLLKRGKEVDDDEKYYKADNGNRDSIVEIVDSSEISTLITDSGFDPSQP